MRTTERSNPSSSWISCAGGTSGAGAVRFGAEGFDGGVLGAAGFEGAGGAGGAAAAGTTAAPATTRSTQPNRSLSARPVPGLGQARTLFIRRILREEAPPGKPRTVLESGSPSHDHSRRQRSA